MAIYKNGKVEELEVGRIYMNYLSHKIQIVKKDDQGFYWDDNGKKYSRFGGAVRQSGTWDLCSRAPECGGRTEGQNE